MKVLIFQYISILRHKHFLAALRNIMCISPKLVMLYLPLVIYLPDAGSLTPVFATRLDERSVDAPHHYEHIQQMSLNFGLCHDYDSD